MLVYYCTDQPFYISIHILFYKYRWNIADFLLLRKSDVCEDKNYIFSVQWWWYIFSLWRRANARNVRLYYPYWQYNDHFIFRFIYIFNRCEHIIVIKQGWFTADKESKLASRFSRRSFVHVSLWRRAYARNVRLYYPYRQYTYLYTFLFASEHCLRSTLYVYFTVKITSWAMAIFYRFEYKKNNIPWPLRDMSVW